MKFLLAFVLCLALFSSAFADIWTNCGTSSDLLTIESVVITPDPPQKNHLLTVTANGTLSSEITGGSAVIQVKYGIFPLYKGTQDICQSEMPCPIQAGHYNRTVSAMIPPAAPSGKYSGSIVLTTTEGAQIACVNVAFTLN